MILSWGLSRLFVAIANVIKWWSESPGLWGEHLDLDVGQNPLIG
jgi:hypothetical protein